MHVLLKLIQIVCFIMHAGSYTTVQQKRVQCVCLHMVYTILAAPSTPPPPPPARYELILYSSQPCMHDRALV